MVKGNRKVIESLYIAKCNIYGFGNVEDEFGRTESKEMLLHEEIPCRVSFKNISTANQTEAFASTFQEIKLFINPEIVISEGSKIEVTQNNRTTMYKSSGTSAVYSNHQEIILKNYKEKA